MQTNIEKKVMRRVFLIRILRPIISGGTLSALVLTLALWDIGREVWVAKVFANGPQDFFGHLTYLGYAFNHTRLIVQALVLVSFAALIYSARETARVFSTFLTPRTI